MACDSAVQLDGERSVLCPAAGGAGGGVVWTGGCVKKQVVETIWGCRSRIWNSPQV